MLSPAIREGVSNVEDNVSIVEQVRRCMHRA